MAVSSPRVVVNHQLRLCPVLPRGPCPDATPVGQHQGRAAPGQGDHSMRPWPAVVCFVAVVSGVAAADLPRPFRPDPRTGTSAAVRIDNVALAHTAQLLPMDEKG